MFEILQARIERDRPSWDRVAFWPITPEGQKVMGGDPLIYAIKPEQFLAAWMVTGILPRIGGGIDNMHELPVIGENQYYQMTFDVAKALVQASKIQLIADRAELFEKQADELLQLQSIADPNTAATLGSVYMGIARDRADMGLPTNMQLNYSADGILTINGKWSSKRPEEAITSWGLENASEIRRMPRAAARKRNRANLKKT